MCWISSLRKNFHVSQNKMSASINDEFLFTNTSFVGNTSVVFHQTESTLSYLLSCIRKIQSNTFISFKAKKRWNLFVIIKMCWSHCFKIIFDLVSPYWRGRWTFIYFAWVCQNLVIIIAWNNWQICSCKVLKTCS